ncbi:hypothetical protein LCGC14_0313000 [marine sediment metagenome]|uniref:RNA polymerase sigma-70 region 4 domain-containing protein n=1 Tax=marine sediment metagenome TaxID=412755 RepID=A0A0F9WT78_9ZZZZ
MTRPRIAIEDIVTLRAGGIRSLQEVGEILGVTRQRVHQLLKRHGITEPYHKHQFPLLQNAEWLHANKHRTAREIARLLGCSVTTVLDHTRAIGITLTIRYPRAVSEATIHSIKDDPRPLHEIGKALGVSVQVLSFWMRRVGVARGGGGPGRIRPAVRQAAQARRAALTHCFHGHAYAEYGYYQTPKGYRTCKACSRLGHQRNHPPKPRIPMVYCKRGHLLQPPNIRIESRRDGRTQRRCLLCVKIKRSTPQQRR